MRWDSMRLQILDCGLQIWLGNVETVDHGPGVASARAQSLAGGTPVATLGRANSGAESHQNASLGGWVADVLALWAPQDGPW